MKNHASKTHECPICKQPKTTSHFYRSDWVSSPIREFILTQHPLWAEASHICLDCLNELRTDYMESILLQERGMLSTLENDVLDSLREHETMARNINLEFERELTFGEKLSDKIAEFGGSWSFISVFLLMIVAWIMVNSLFLLRRPFDPYPYILLNLLLSCVAALQAPIIMMSQNRQESKDRLRSEHDYRVNLKAELEIRHLHAKIDQLLTSQWEHLVEIQKVQMDMLKEILQLSSKKS